MTIFFKIVSCLERRYYTLQLLDKRPDAHFNEKRTKYLNSASKIGLIGIFPWNFHMDKRFLSKQKFCVKKWSICDASIFRLFKKMHTRHTQTPSPESTIQIPVISENQDPNLYDFFGIPHKFSYFLVFLLSVVLLLNLTLLYYCYFQSKSPGYSVGNYLQPPNCN